MSVAKKMWVAVVVAEKFPAMDLYADADKKKVLKFQKKLSPSMGKYQKVVVVKKAA